MSHVIREEVQKAIEEMNRSKSEGEEKLKLEPYAEDKLDEIEREIEKFRDLPTEEQEKEKEDFVKKMRGRAKDAMGTSIFDYDDFYSSSGFLSKAFEKVGLI